MYILMKFQIEIKIIIAKIIQNFKFELDPDQSFEYVFNGNIVPKSGVIVKTKKRILSNKFT